ncbi:hypothetical protein BD310DRAFT_920854 [Dichomitus squalens]|uniref:Secreted protein n=1 Tax=Dichomitus squalens TaxID=114155 RepID=A0A4V2K8V7_9APHY|nr:hypothetical protein BD310DRAFT_920854 [Dichomitus squalens]
MLGVIVILLQHAFSTRGLAILSPMSGLAPRSRATRRECGQPYILTTAVLRQSPAFLPRPAPTALERNLLHFQFSYNRRELTHMCDPPIYMHVLRMLESGMPRHESMSTRCGRDILTQWHTCVLEIHDNVDTASSRMIARSGQYRF